MELFHNSPAASLAMALLVGLVSAAPTWWALGKAEVAPGVQRLITGLDFTAFCVGTAYILYFGLLA